MWNPTPRHLAPAPPCRGALLPRRTRPAATAPSDPARQAEVYGRLGALYDIQGDEEQAERMVEKALALHERHGTAGGSAAAALQYGNLSLLKQHRGDYLGSREFARKVGEMEDDIVRRHGTTIAYGRLGLLYTAERGQAAAEALHRQSFELHRKLDRPRGMATACANLGLLARQQGNVEKAREMWETARSLYLRAAEPLLAQRLEEWLARLGPRT